MTRQQAIAAWAENVREIRAAATAKAQQVYDEWLRSGMSAPERDRRMAAIREAEEAAVQALGA